MLNEDIIKDSWEKGWKEEFQKSQSKFKDKSFSFILHNSAVNFSNKNKGVFSQEVKMEFPNSGNNIGFKNNISRILGISPKDENLSELVLIALGETKESVAKILGLITEEKTIDKKETLLSSDELIQIWNTIWSQNCIEKMKEGFAFSKAFFISAQELDGPPYEEIKKLAQKYPSGNVRPGNFLFIIARLLETKDNSIKTDLLLQKLFQGNRVKIEHFKSFFPKKQMNVLLMIKRKNPRT